MPTIIDYPEYLARGIIAVRSGDIPGAQYNLMVANQMNPRQPRPLLWLAAASPRRDQQAKYLQAALKLDPDCLPAKVLLEKLNKELEDPAHVMEGTTVVSLFRCSGCGGRTHFDPDFSCLACDYCGRVEHLVAENAAEEERDLPAAIKDPGAGNWALLSSRLSCPACGAQTVFPPHVKSLTCPFCGSEKVVEQAATPGLTTPNAIAPFAITREGAASLAQRWFYKGLFHIQQPRRMDVSQMHLSPLYIPFWTFDGQVRLRPQVEVTPTPVIYSAVERRVRDTWTGLVWYERDFDDITIYASATLPVKELKSILPYDLKALVKYQPEYLAGWPAEIYQVSLVDAAAEAYQRMRHIAFRAAERRMLVHYRFRTLPSEAEVVQSTYKLALLPLWVGQYQYKGKAFRFFVNGQTGRVGGARPGIRERFSLLY